MSLLFRDLGKQDYEKVWQSMREFTDARNKDTTDEIWFVEHPPVFTQGQAGKAEHILNPGDIPIVQTDRGGQVTYHGPGQLVAYTMIDLKRRGLTVRELVTMIEQVIIDTLAQFDICATSRRDAPGVYVKNEKICSLGLRIRHGYSYHGLALNVDMDLEPFSRINPCGFSKLAMTQIKNNNNTANFERVKQKLKKTFSALFSPVTT